MKKTTVVRIIVTLTMCVALMVGVVAAWVEVCPTEGWAWKTDSAAAVVCPTEIASTDTATVIWSGLGPAVADGDVVEIVNGANGMINIPANATVTVIGGSEESPIDIRGIFLAIRFIL